MADDILLFREPKFLGLTKRRWQRIGHRVLVAALILIWGFAAYQFGADRSAALVSDAWGFLRYHTIGSKTSADGITLRRMTTCLGPVRINCIVDGDTVWVDGEKIRISGIDAPEIEGKCHFERNLAEQAKHRLSELLSAEPFVVARTGEDRYGRTLATIHLRYSGDVGLIMVRDGLARPWVGRRMPWC